MSAKTLLSREEFEALRKKAAADLTADQDIQKMAIQTLIKADRHYWLHQTNWFGEPILNTAEDMFALSEVICQTRPDFVIESGVAWGGSLLFYATILEALGQGQVIGIDIYLPDDLKTRLNSHGKISKRVTLLQGSSVDPAVLGQLKKILKGSRKVLVVLDSDHTHAHVLKELQLYSTLVGKNYYLVCCDTIIEDIPEQNHRPRPWGHGNNPRTALKEFFLTNDRFAVDQELENKILFSCNRSGYLRCVKD